MNLPFTILVLGAGVSMVWVGIQDPAGGLLGEIGRVLKGEPATTKTKTSLSGAETAALILSSGDGPNSGVSSGGSAIPTSTGGGGNSSAALNAARSMLGTPYVYGGGGSSGPSSGGFDCSGLTQYAYAKAGISIPRVAAAQQSAASRISESEAVPGDAVFFGYPAYHCGIVSGGGQMIHAPHTGTVVRYEPIANVRPGPVTYGRFQRLATA
ncbi:C40 family peptidase [Kitasatospora sp. NPDC059747]|uniref:C40 family peptidase n=1 Tax=Kitasatospora sp. NPDC059747 TaxID=3346930 RepID=UPI00366A4C90